MGSTRQFVGILLRRHDTKGIDATDTFAIRTIIITTNPVLLFVIIKTQEAVLSPRDLCNAPYQFKCWPTVVRIMQTDHMSA